MSSLGRYARWTCRGVVLGAAVWLIYVTAPVLGWQAPAIAPVAAPAPADNHAAPSTAAHGNGAAPVAAIATDEEAEYGPDVVVLDELVELYEPVPFNHKGHAKMAEMWDGCVTCHHHSPEVPARPDRDDAEEAPKYPPCKECHSPAVEDVTVRMPGLKGAYHRQCLNCHKEWMHANACVVCHMPRDPQRRAAAPTSDDIVGRMHPPIPEPDIRVYRTRLTPADGPNVTFRHKEHTARFGLKCVNCHRRDNCANCHDAQAGHSNLQVMKPGKTWAESHEPCANCHQSDRCGHCHYQDAQAAPPPFDHKMTGQLLDANHDQFACAKCHLGQRFVSTRMTCGNGNCHDLEKGIAFPAYRPGPVVCQLPEVAVETPGEQPRPQPTTRAVIQRIRR